MIKNVIIAIFLLTCMSIVCEAKDKVGKDTGMTWWVKDLCNDAHAINIAFYSQDRKDWYWGDYYLQYAGKSLRGDITCRKGEKICYGAWSDNYTWGCGEKCEKACKDCCYICGEGNPNISFECN